MYTEFRLSDHKLAIEEGRTSICPQRTKNVPTVHMSACVCSANCYEIEKLIHTKFTVHGKKISLDTEGRETFLQVVYW